MIIKNVNLEAVAVEKSQYPTSGLPEVALLGRSNVGKSSLINKLLNRKAIARVSSDPGKTRTINFYNCNNALYLVDLPGYGYARVSKEEKRKWGNIIDTYLNSRAELKSVILLIDSRHEPTSDDLLMLNWIRAKEVLPVIAATKCDKLSNSQLIKNVLMIKNKLKLNDDEILVQFSSVTGKGREKVWSIIEENCF